MTRAESGLLIFAVVIGFVLGAVIMINVHKSEYRAMIAECEKEMPRNEHCELVALPKERGNE